MVIRVHILNYAQQNYIHQLFKSGEFDFWTEKFRRGVPADIMLTPKQINSTLHDLVERGIKYQILIHDVQR